MIVEGGGVGSGLLGTLVRHDGPSSIARRDSKEPQAFHHQVYNTTILQSLQFTTLSVYSSLFKRSRDFKAIISFCVVQERTQGQNEYGSFRRIPLG